MSFTVLTNFIIAIALGALIGIERQRGQKSGGFAGIRTFVLISFLGALGAFLSSEFNLEFMFPVLFTSVALLIAISYFVSAKKGFLGITAEISAFITFLLGFIVMFDDYRNYALVFGVLMTVLLSFKEGIHNFIENTEEVEWNDTLKFSLIAFVVLPLLPSEVNLGIFSGRFSDLNIINPKEWWLLVVLVSLISFVGYFLMKTIGGKKGANVTGALGGIVSSTAVAQSMAIHSKTKMNNGKVAPYKTLAGAVILATVVSFVRIGFLTIIINDKLSSVALPLLIAMILGLISFLVISRDKTKFESNLKLESPLKLKPALILACLYAVLTFATKAFTALNIGKSGIVMTSAITGFLDVDPVILTVGSLAGTNALQVSDALTSVLLAIGANQISKGILVMTTGSKKFGRLAGSVLIVLGLLFVLFGL